MAARILIIDDSPVMRDLLVDFLSDAGYEVFATEHPEEAIAEASRSQFDLCICDKHLARHDGQAVIRQMDEQFQNTKFILTDSLPTSRAIEKARTERFLYIGKPFELDHLRDLIRASLNQCQVRPE